MRWLTFIIIAAGLAWSGYWYIGKSSREAGINRWLEDRVEQGWVASSDVSLRGYPNRYDAILSDIILANPKSGWAWNAKQLELLTLSYEPNHIIALFPQSQLISSPKEKITVTSSDMQASLNVTERNSLTLQRATLSAKDLELNSSAGWKNSAKNAILAIRQSQEGSNFYDVALSADDFQPSNVALKELNRGGIMPATFTTFKMDAIVEYDQPLSKQSFESGSAIMQGLDIKDIHLEWGDIVLRAAGKVKLDAEGYPDGKFSLRAVNWQSMIDIAIANNSLDAKMGQRIKDALGFVAKLTGKKDTIDVPLKFSNRKTRLGPITLGPAPQIKFP